MHIFKCFIRMQTGYHGITEDLDILLFCHVDITFCISRSGKLFLEGLKTETVVILEYSEETAGQFDQYYSGAANKLNEYDITFTVPAIESTNMLMFQ